MGPDNDLPHDWDLDMQYEDRYSCLGDAETCDDTYDTLALDPADESNYDADTDPATGTEYGELA